MFSSVSKTAVNVSGNLINFRFWTTAPLREPRDDGAKAPTALEAYVGIAYLMPNTVYVSSSPMSSADVDIHFFIPPVDSI